MNKQNIIGQRIVNIEFGDDPITDVVYLIDLEGGEVLNAWNGNPCYIAYDVATGANLGARLVAIALETNHNGDEYLHYRFE